MAIKTFLRRNKDYLLVLIPPLILLPLPLIQQTPESKCAFGLLLMGCYWTTEAFPLPVTAMLAIVLFPMMGISKVSTLAPRYFASLTFVLFGGLAVAIAIERWGVHKRFALRMLLFVGTSPKFLMLGFMLITSFLSMWMSNTATTSMMIPIAQSVLVQLLRTIKKGQRVEKETEEIRTEKTESLQTSTGVKTDVVEVKIEFTETGIIDRRQILKVSPKDNCAVDGKVKNRIKNDESVKTPLNDSEHDNTEKDDAIEYDSLDKYSKKLCKAMLLSICYAANCGGIATLTGTGPNLVMKGQADLISNGKSGISFASWFVFSFPVAFINVFVAWFAIQITLFGIRSLFKGQDAVTSKSVRKVIQDEYDKLGKTSFAEKAVFVHFVLLVGMWFSLEPEFAPGWSELFRHGYVTDAVPAILITCMLFVCPSNRDQQKDGKRAPPLLDWETYNSRFPWSVSLLLGGGFALAQACQDSGLSIWLAEQLSVFGSISPWGIVIIVCIVVSLSTEVTTNTAIATIYMPILAELAKGIHLHPIYLMLPAAISTSFAFMLPVATPPNTIAFSYKYLKVVDMIRAGCCLNFICVLVVCIAINTWGTAYFNLDVYPEWAIVQKPLSNSSNWIHYNMTDSTNFTTLANINKTT